MTTHIHIDSMLPTEMAQIAEDVGSKKANLDFWTLFAFNIMAGAMVSSKRYTFAEGNLG